MEWFYARNSVARRLTIGFFFIAALGVAWVHASPARGEDAPAAPTVNRVERGSLVLEGIPEVPDDVLQRLERYQNTRSASFQGWLPDGGGILISIRFGETRQIHRVAHPAGARHQLTFYPEPVGGARISPSPKRPVFLFTKDVGGSEFYQIFLYDLASGDVSMLTDGKSRNGGVSWSNGGDRFAFYTTQRNGQDWDIHIAGVGSDTPGASKAVLKEGGAWVPGEWSPDDTLLLVTRYVSANENHPHLLEIATGQLTPLLETTEQVSYGGAKFAADGRGLFFTSDADSEFKRLHHMDLATKTTRAISGDLLWDVESFDVSPDGRYLVFSINEDGFSRLVLRDLESGKNVELPALPTGLVGSLRFSPDGKHLGMGLNTPSTPGDVFSLNLKDGNLVRWTSSEVGGLDPDRFVEPTLVRYPTFDEHDGARRTIPALYYRPAGKGPFPVLIEIHGGPEGQRRPSFNPTVQALMAELGVAVLSPNVRGSSGYGKSYLLLDNGMRREDSVRDIGALLDWIDQQEELDASKVAVMGGSYGGYMVLASMVHYNDRLKAGVDVVGISNFVTFLKNTQGYRRDLRRVEYGDERDEEMLRFLESIAPTRQADKIQRPLLVAQGLNDPRVPASESEQMVKVIRDNGGEVWYFLAKDEGHGFRKKGNRKAFEATVMMFLERYLVGED